MYEIWLMLNIVFEVVAPLWPLIAGVAAVWLVLLAWQRRRLGQVPGALLAGVVAVVTIAGVLLLPTLTRSSITEMGYWVDWANLLALAIGGGVMAALLAWPLLAWRAGAH